MKRRLNLMDYFAVFLTADVLSAILFAILAGSIEGVIFLPVILLLWFSYENLRRFEVNNDRE